MIDSQKEAAEAARAIDEHVRRIVTLGAKLEADNGEMPPMREKPAIDQRAGGAD